MTQQRIRKLLVLASAVLIVTINVGCRRRSEIVINVLRDARSPSNSYMENKILDFVSRSPKTAAGNHIAIQSIYFDSAKFEEVLTNRQKLHNVKPDVIFLDSENQAFAHGLPTDLLPAN